MSYAVVNTRAVAGIEALPVAIEVYLSKGLPGLHIVGLPQTVVRESKHRVRSALWNSGFRVPTSKIIVNLAPADLPKIGGCFDLPIALGILAASSQIPKEKLDEYEFAAELALTGELRPIKAALPLSIATHKNQRKLILPISNVEEAALIEEAELYPAKTLVDVCAHLLGAEFLPMYECGHQIVSSPTYPDLSEVIGQVQAKRSLELTAAGGHNLLLIGPPGSGKTMLASRLPGILPAMSEQEALEVAAIYSISQKGFSSDNWGLRPFRAPHHTASSPALAGGGNPPQPGELSMAHCGVLFLDELPEFNRQVLEVLREPLESGVVLISRAANQAVYPAKVQLIAAMNPCPCGYFGDRTRNCQCTVEQIRRYQTRISGPLLDRFDLHVDVSAMPQHELFNKPENITETNEIVRARVAKARKLQLQRNNKANALLSNQEVSEYCEFSKPDQVFLQQAITKLGLSARAYFRVLKLARTIADIDENEIMNRKHLQEAISYRSRQLTDF